MRKKIIIQNAELKQKSEKRSALASNLNGKTISALELSELQLLVEYLARRQDLLDSADRLTLD